MFSDNPISKIAERRIKEAQEKGEFRDLPGEGKPLLLVVFRASDHPSWAAVPRKKWTVLAGTTPSACVWRRGDYVYALVGEASGKKMWEIAQAVTPPGRDF